MEFNQAPIIEEGLDDLLSDQEKKERIRKALEIHMLENREAHMRPAGQTIFSFTQGDPNAMVGTSHGFGQAVNTGQDDGLPKKSIEQQRMEQQQQWESRTDKQAQAMPVRTCPCCVRFLKGTFGMSDKEVDKFIGGIEGGPVGYQGGSSGGDSYASGGGSNEYAGSGGANYSGSSGGYAGSSGGSGGYGSGGPTY